MTTAKTEHRIRKTIATEHSGSRHIAPAPEISSNGSAAMSEACNRLGEKLDAITGLMREQIEIWRQSRSPSTSSAHERGSAGKPAVEHAMTHSAARMEKAPDEAQPERTIESKGAQGAGDAAPAQTAPMKNGTPQVETARWEKQSDHDAGTFTEEKSPEESADAPPADASATASPAPEASRLIDTFARARQRSLEQVAGAQQALEAIMSFLENQAANPPPQIDTADILSRLKDLEIQQQNLQTQFNTSRMGP